MKKKLIVIVITIILLFMIFIVIKGLRKVEKPNEEEKIKTKDPISFNESDFNINIIKTVNSTTNSNYLISPYSIEIALNMLKEGSNNKTKDEILKFTNRSINKVSKDVKIANAIFVKDIYINHIENNFYNTIKNKYNGEIIYDEFKTPILINNWVKDKTNEMIPTILDEIDKDFVLGIINALAIDVKWANKFDCSNTSSKEFTKIDNTKIDVEMMHKTYEEQNAKYFSNEEVTGIILPYNNSDLEFVAILPNDKIDNYINNLTIDKLNNIDKDFTVASNKTHIILSLPRFSYSYEIEDFIKVLKAMGIKEVFDRNNADLTNIMSEGNMKALGINNLYVEEAIHKTNIDLNEDGTKAAAVTYFGVYKATSFKEEDFKEIKIEFNKPFIYMIRDKNTKEILFFGVLYEPNIWNGMTCN